MDRNFNEEIKDQKTIDPSEFGDPIAIQAGWTPIRYSGDTNISHDLINVGSYRLEYKMATAPKIFFLIFAVVGIIFALILTIIALLSGDAGKFFWLGALFCLLFPCAAAFGYYYYSTPIYFDKRHGLYYKGRKSTDNVVSSAELKNCARFEDIYALQLIPERCTVSTRDHSRSVYYSYELNLVLRSGKRMNVLDHANLERIRQDAKTISDFLGKPIWDAIH